MKRIVATFLSIMSAIIANSQSISVNTDVAMLALQTYNIGAEMTIGNRSTLGLSVFANNKRYWHTETKMVTRYDGFAAGAGLTFGYVASISNRWTIDAHAGIGLVLFHQKKTTDGQPNLEISSGVRTSDGYTGYQILPTKIGVTLSYILR